MIEKVQFHKQDIFQTGLIWCDAVLSSQEQKKIIKDILDYENSCSGTYTGGGFTTYDVMDNILDLENCIGIKMIIEDIVQAVHDSLKFKGKVKISSSWGTVGRKFSSHNSHNHLPNLWSGVYYLKAENSCAPIEFIDRNKDNNWPWDYKTEDNKYASSTSVVQPVTGRLLIFPGYVQHSVLEQTDNEDRITIAFNCNADF